MAILTLAELVEAGALAYALGRLTRGDTVAELWDRLHRKYPDQPGADLDSMVEMALQQEAIRALVATGDPMEPLGPDVLPFVPGLPAGMFQVDVQYEIPGAPTRAGRTGFFRLDFDSLDILTGLIFFLNGSPAQRPGIFAEVRDILSSIPPGTLVGDITKIFPDLFPEGYIAPPEIANMVTPLPPTPAIIEEIIKRAPADEPERLVPPREPGSPKGPHKNAVYNAAVLFLARG